MKKILIFFLFSLNYSFSQWVFDNIPEPKIKENGKCIVYYEMTEYHYIENSNIIDWYKSGKIIDKSEPLKNNKIYFIEKFRQKDAVKNGEFTLEMAKATKLSSGSLTLTSIGVVMNGAYLMGKLNGEINILTMYAKDLETPIKISYSSNNISDQEIKFNSQKIKLGLKELDVLPKIVFRKGRVFESTFYAGETWNYYIEKENNTSIKFTYTENHFAREYYKEKLLECIYFKRNQNNNLVIDKIQMFDLNNILFDTTKILAFFSIKENQLNGVSKIWKRSDKKLNIPSFVINYKNNLKDGEYVNFYDDGKVREKYNFKDGFLSGKGEIYVSKSDNYDFFMPTNIQSKNIEYYLTNMNYNDAFINKSSDVINLFNIRSNSLIVPVALIMAHIGKNHNNKYNDSYYDITKIDYFKFCDLEFEYNESFKKSNLLRYDIYIGTDKFLERNLKNCEDCFSVFDKDSNVILSKEIMDDYKNKKDKQSEIEYQKMLKKEINCAWCSKKIILENSISTVSCDCIKDGKPILVGINRMFYCSRKCSSDASKQRCRELGYE
jgi:antitoxin component YwqK of YwqJK toxin-antitoxin module